MTPQKTPLTVLDLGCHDGFVGYHLLQQPDVHVELYGVELHPRGIEDAERRGYTRVLQGIAEDAPTLFPELVGRCDAVVIFEVLEHVPHMDRLLSAAERMLSPLGRIYVSTPDGTFGDGGNPHHLRALRSIDVADLLRRRGDLLDMTVGPDTVASAAYRPRTRIGECAIYCGPGWETWSPTDINARGLGGSETAAVRLAEALNDLGWVVTVYGDVDQCAWGSGVIFRHHTVFDPLQPVDLLISSRIPELFDRPNRAARTALWVHDVDCGDRLTRARARQIDHLLVLSEWQAGHVRGRYPFAAHKVHKIRNGINHDRFAAPASARESRVLYTSSPDRGLDVLLELWPHVLARVPDAQLQACYSPVYQRVADLDPVVGAHATRIRELADQPGVTLLPAQGQQQLADLMLASRVWCAPSWNTPGGQPFHETSCIGAMEAQAAGLHVVASNWGALPETVQVGALVDGPPLGDQWRAAFVDEIVRGLTDHQVQAHAEHEAPAAVAAWGWGPVADELTRLARR